MKKFFTGLVLGLSVAGALAAPLAKEVQYVVCKAPDGSTRGSISVVKEGIKVVIGDAVKVLSWEDVDLLRQVSVEL